MTPHSKPLKGIKALVMGLGLHGGGVASVKWLLTQGAKVTATDMRSRKELAPSLRLLKGLPVRYVLGRHRPADFKANDLVVVNPGVRRESEFIAAAQKAKKRIENDTSLFFRFDEHVKIAVTGTRGKSTTTLFIAELLKKKYPLVSPSGNTPKNALLHEYARVKGKDVPVVAELSSWQLEYLIADSPHSKEAQMRGAEKVTKKTYSYMLTESQRLRNNADGPLLGEVRAPHIAVITNLYPDHLNRYRDIEDYADAKANIFFRQNDDDFLILNKQNKWTGYFLKKKPKSMVFYTSVVALRGKENGIFIRNGYLIFRADDTEQRLFGVAKFIAAFGAHNLENLMAAILAVKLYDPAIPISEREVLRLPLPEMRQEEVYKKGHLRIINDSCATSPDGAVAAVRRFRKEGELLLITGGTDKELDFTPLRKVMKELLSENNVILLGGSGTDRLRNGLGNFHPSAFATLEECVREAKDRIGQKKGKATLLFSPGAASFERFLHEFDRGEKFNKLVKKYFK
jgi:UDP-N-acetylmuramoylalanine--D-glutamate ligase